MRRLASAAVLLVAAIAATVSFLHIERLAVQLGQPPLAAWLMPLSVDGTVCAGSAALLWAAREAVPAPVMARPMLALGVLATLGANADFGGRPRRCGDRPVGVARNCFRRIGRGRSRHGPEVSSRGHAGGHRGGHGDGHVGHTEAVTVTATRPPPERSPRPVRPAPRAAAIVRANPGISGAELGRKLGLSARQGRRLLQASRPA